MAAVALPAVLWAEQRPNIIYIMTDQQTASAMSCAGNSDVHTPNMDLLASRGVRFVNAYCAFPLSGPTRSSMFTGYMPSQIGTIENNLPIPDSVASRTLGTLLSESGYYCAYAGKWHAHTVSLPAEEAFGFHNICPNGDIGLAEACVRFLQSKPAQPFFLVASFTNPHNICEYARNQRTPYAHVEEPVLDECPNLPLNHEVAPFDSRILAFEKKQSYALYPTQDYTPEEWRRYLNAYYRLVEAVDHEIGKIVAEIERENLWKNTVIIFTSDHGDGCASHKWNQKTALYEEVVNVPLIVCAPKVKHPGMVLPQLVNNAVDLMPSVLDWAETVCPSYCKGVSYREISEKALQQEAHQPYVVTETNFNQTAGTLGWMVRTPRYKYVLYDKGAYREQLFDMTSSRLEMKNLAVEAKYKEVLEQHRNLLREWMKQHPAPRRGRHLSLIP